MNKKYKIITFGCQMNVHESEKLAGMLESLDYKGTEITDSADIIVFNTCTIRQNAVNRAFGNIGNLKKLKKLNPNLIIAVGGCMPQKDDDAQLLKKTFPFVDIVFGTHNLYKFKQYLLQVLEKNEKIFEVWPENTSTGTTNTSIKRDSKLNAWVNIMYGCNNFCTYCVVPYVRGREKSRNVSDIIAEVKGIIKQGYKFITLLGQNVNSYGNDTNDTEQNFPNLIEKIAKIQGDFKIKFMTSHPKDLSDKLIEKIAKYDKISKAVHLPLQSGSNSVLKEMNRKYTAEHYLKIVRKLKDNIQGLTLSSDFIVGFPGESTKDYELTKELIEQVKYDTIFAYIFSPRKGTLAYKMPDNISKEEKSRRVNELLSIQKTISEEKLKQYVGTIRDAIIINKIDKFYIAELDNGKNVKIPTETELEINSFYKIKIIQLREHKELIAEVLI